MQETTSRQKVLKNIRNALITASDNPYADARQDIRPDVVEDNPLEIQFASAFSAEGGNFVYCETPDELSNALLSLLKGFKQEDVFFRVKDMQRFGLEDIQSDIAVVNNCRLSVTACESLIASSGSILVASENAFEHLAISRPEKHIVLALLSQIKPGLADALQALKEINQNSFPAYTSLITGPSRTADIEKTLVKGMHGPKELYVCLLDDLNYD